jgi:hypothetical protein
MAPANEVRMAAKWSAAVIPGNSRSKPAYGIDDCTQGVLGRLGSADKIPEELRVRQVDQLSKRVPFAV